MYNQEDNFARMQFSFSIMILQRLQCQLIHQSPKKTIEKKKLSNKASSIEIDPNKEDNFPTPDKVGNDFFDHLNHHKLRITTKVKNTIKLFLSFTV